MQVEKVPPGTGASYELARELPSLLTLELNEMNVT